MGTPSASGLLSGRHTHTARVRRCIEARRRVCDFRWSRCLDFKFGDVCILVGFVSLRLTAFDTSEGNISEPSACQRIIIIIGFVGNTLQIPTVLSGVVYEVKQPLPQNTIGIPADRKLRMNPVWFTLTGYLRLQFKFQSQALHICIAEDHRRNGGERRGNMLSSCHTLCLISLF